MSLNGNNVIGSSGHRTNQPPYEIDQSLRLDGYPGTTNQHLERSPSSSGNRKTFTISFWHKPSLFAKAEGDHYIKVKPDANNQFQVSKNASTDTLLIYIEVGGTYKQLYTERVFRDPSQWYHFVIAVDTTQATASNRVKLYVNGVQETDFGTEQYPDQDWELPYNQSGVNQDLLWSREDSGRSPSGYFAEWHSIDGTALDASSFGETNADTNQWVPIKYTGSYGTNGFYLKFQDSSTLGDDSSGNTNDFTATNLAATDQVLDSPTNNFATLNPLLGSTIDRFTLKEGNLEGTTNGSDWNVMVGNMALPDSGKWYWETSTNNNNAYTGIVDESEDLTVTNPTGGVVYYLGDGRKRIDGTFSSYGAAASGGDIIGVAVDMDASPRTIEFYKNNVSQGSITITGSCATDTVFPYLTTLSTTHLNFGADSSFAGYKTAQGNTDGNGIGDFYYTPPSGFVALCSDNLPDPSIADPTNHFNTVLYTGNGATRNLTGVGFQPDFVWHKYRGGSGGHNLFDSVRGALKRLRSNDTSSEATGTDTLTGFISDGVSLGADTYGDGINISGYSNVIWNWKAGGTASSNTDGSVTSSVSANTDAGMSVVTWTNHNVTVGHGLSQAPELIIIKDRSAVTSWLVYSEPVGNSHTLFLNSTSAQSSGTTYFNSTSPTSSVFSVGTGIGGSTDNYLAYCFHSVDGYSKVGSYSGNSSSSDGSFIYTGFRPAYVLWKRTDSTGYNWGIRDNARDTYNVTNKRLQADSSNAETTDWSLDFLSNGFKWYDGGGATNASGGTYIYLAFAESPFKYSNAR